MEQTMDSWQGGQLYERFMGRWSRGVAREFLRWLPVSEQRVWLDVGCGSGALSSLILATTRPAHVVAVDSSPDLVAFARAINKTEQFDCGIASALSLPTVSNRFDTAISGLVLNFLSHPEQALAEMRRVTRPGGVVAAYVWDYAEGMQMLRFFWDAAVALDRNAAALDEAVRFPLCEEGKLQKLFSACGLYKVTFKAIEIPTVFASIEDYWQPFLGGAGPAPGYVNLLADSQRLELKERLQETLPQSQTGTISLTARAWAVRGTV